MSKYKSRSEVPEKYKWDLTDFYKNEDEFNKDLEEAKKRIKEEEKFRGCCKSGKTLYEFLKYDEVTECMIENLYVYSFIKDDEELGKKENINRKNKAMLLLNDYGNAISFFTPELLKLSQEDFNDLFKYEKLNEYKFMLDEAYKNKGHVLSEKEEIIINELESAMNNFDDISSNLLNNEHNYGTVTIDGKEEEIHSTNLRKLLKNKNPEIRKEVFFKYKKVLDQYGGTCAALLNSYVKNNNVTSRLHNFKNAWDAKLFDYNMPQKAYDTLVDVVNKNYDSVRKYFDLYKESYNLKELHVYDLSLDLYPSTKKYTIEEGIELIRNAINPLGDEYMECFNKIIDNHYIDYCEYKGKCSGGYSISTPDHDSRILLSYNDDLSSVSTIAHECGHNVHHQFVKKYNPIQYRNITTLVAEVVSLTNECLLSSYLANNGTKEEKLAGISNILNVIDNNLFDCIREAKMETEFNKYSEEGNAITKEYMNELDLKSLKEYYGDSVIIDDLANTGWIRRSHYYMNYYLYNYSFCVSVASANALKILSGDKDQLERYIKFMSLGSDIYPIDAFKVLGFDLTSKEVYETAIKYFDSLVDKYKQIIKE
ncbi:MAG: oligoendopeptidase F family protein [Bacilli bacterium]|nr:oligoendopeptidase F family protein [Bacilli bacterium]